MNTEASSNHAIRLEGVVKKFHASEEGPPALWPLSTSIKRGRITGLVGPDGAGKTTLIRLIAGLLSLTEGNITVEGLNPSTELDALHRIIGYMPQKFGLYEDLSVMENLMLYANLRGVLEEERTKTFERLLQFTNLNAFIARPAGKLSGGMKQKLGLACALLGHPKVLLLDEPSVGVDPISRRELWRMVNELVSGGITVIWSTSYLDEAELCHEVLLMNEGKLIYNGPPDSLTDSIIGRSVQVQKIQGSHRLVLKSALRDPEVMDGVIQGQNVRLLLRKADEKPSLASLHAGSEAIIAPVKPRFEDAFMDLLGGGPGSESVLTNVMKPVQITTDSNAVIEASKLTKQFGDFVATDNISFTVKRGEIFGLLGPNGAGKSTTFKMMCGLLTPTSGAAKVLGLDLQQSASLARQQIGYMAQKFSLYNDLTVRQNLEFFSGIYGLYGNNQQQKIQEMVDAFDLKHFLKTKTLELPLGFKQRLALACAIMHEPAILFLDEPTSGVDPITRREFWTHINGLVEKGVTIMVTTHYMDEAEYCDRIGLIYRGLLIAAGTPDELKQAASTKQQPDPTMEEAFIELVTHHDANSPVKVATLKQESTQHAISIPFITNRPGLRRWLALCQKEFYQIIRDPSSILMAFILPLIMLFIFGFGVNLDSTQLNIGMIIDPSSVEAKRLEQTFKESPYINLIPITNKAEGTKQLIEGSIRGLVVLQSNFDERLKQANAAAPIQVITDGTEPNVANFVNAYVTGAWNIWQQQRALETANPSFNAITIENRYWFNSAAISRYFLIPGSIVLIMTVIGSLLTSLVIAREWENGTMEALLATPMTRLEFVGSKLFSYYVLGIIAMSVCTLTAVFVMGTPFRGSLILLFITTSLFLGNVLGIGLLFSTLTRNQFNAAQAALNVAYLPALMLSGFIYEISSMPIVVQAITYLVPARYFVSTLHTLFLAGNVGPLLLKNILFLLIFALFFLGLTYKFTGRRLD